jgi:hypothetical protein
MNDKKETPSEFIFVDPKNDVAFRKIFGDESKKEILISFLNNILEFAGTTREIIDITIKNPYQVPKLKELKDTILDIKAVDKRNIHYATRHLILDEKTNEHHFQDFELNFVELPKFTKTLEEGKEIGIKEGKKEMAKKMKKKGEPLEKISEYSGLSKEEIEDLR